MTNDWEINTILNKWNYKTVCINQKFSKDVLVFQMIEYVDVFNGFWTKKLRSVSSFKFVDEIKIERLQFYDPF
jgi:hypothetical protein